MQKEALKRREDERKTRNQHEMEHLHSVKEFTSTAEMPLKSSLKNSRERYKKSEYNPESENVRHRSTSYTHSKSHY